MHASLLGMAHWLDVVRGPRFIQGKLGNVVFILGSRVPARKLGGSVNTEEKMAIGGNQPKEGSPKEQNGCVMEEAVCSLPPEEGITPVEKCCSRVTRYSVCPLITPSQPPQSHWPSSCSMSAPSCLPHQTALSLPCVSPVL